MFSEAPVLIAENDLYQALDLSIAVEEMDGRVAGPASSVAEALTLLATHDIAAAIVDCHLADRDATPLARQLAERRVPFVIHTAHSLPQTIAELHPDVPVMMKPVHARALLTCLIGEMRKSGQFPDADAGPTGAT
jgi:DNA-binding NtrC family response regulator